MRSEYDAQKLSEAFVGNMEDDDFRFIDDSRPANIDLEGMRTYGIYLVKLSAALNFMEDIQTMLDTIDEPTLDQANDKAFDMMHAFIEEQPFE